jgi:hypothetical protein
MPPLPPVLGVLKFTIEGTTPAAKWVNLLHFGYTGAAPTGPNCSNFADLLGTAWVSNFSPLMLTSATIAKATCIDLASVSGAGSEAAAISPGSRGTAEVPGSAAVVVSKHTARRYRGGHARTYVLAGIQTDLADTAHWSGALVAAVTSAYEAVQTAVEAHTEGATTTTGEVMVSYMTTDPITHLPVRRVTPLVDAVLSVAAQARIGSQRRRLGR